MGEYFATLIDASQVNLSEIPASRFVWIVCLFVFSGSSQSTRSVQYCRISKILKKGLLLPFDIKVKIFPTNVS